MKFAPGARGVVKNGPLEINNSWGECWSFAIKAGSNHLELDSETFLHVSGYLGLSIES
jgi:hypothetical protein